METVMTSFRIYKRIGKCRKAWDSLVSPENGKIYLTSDFHRIFQKKFFFFRILHPHTRLRYICGENKNGITVIFPLIVSDRQKTLSLVGSNFNVGYTDVICGEDTPDSDILETFGYIRETYKGYRFNAADVSGDGRLSRLLPSSFMRSCYRLTVGNGYADWHRSLSHSERSSFNTAYNRLTTDGKKLDFSIAEKLSFREARECYDLFFKRMIEIDAFPSYAARSGLQKTAERIYRLLISPFFLTTGMLKRTRIFRLRIDGKLASFYIGYTEGNGIILPRCGIESDFARYSPGKLLFSEVVKANCTDGHPFIIDLSRGYWEYKVRYGATEYQNNRIEITL